MDENEKDLKIKELEGSWLRAVADYKNLERRCTEEKEMLVQFSTIILLERLIPVLDNLEAVYAHLKDQGLDMAVKEFKTVIKEQGVEEIATAGKDFDPMLMEAVEVVEGEDNKIVSVVRKGYILNNKVIRPARVTVGKKKEE